MIGAGHIADMNNRMKQNRSIMNLKNAPLHPRLGIKRIVKKKKPLTYPTKVSAAELDKIKTAIRLKATNRRKKEWTLSLIIAGVFVIALAIWLLNSIW